MNRPGSSRGLADPAPGAAPGPPVWALTDLVLGWSGVPALRGLSGVIRRGEWLALVGPNGAGKTTLLRALAGAMAPLAGRLEGAGPAADRVLLPQDAGVDRSLPLSVLDFLSLGLWRSSGAWGRANRREQHDALAQALHRVGLDGLGARRIGELSVGQFQRLLFARAALTQASVLLLDEPFHALDDATTDALIAVLEGWHAEGRTIVVVLHDLARVRRHVPRTLLLAGGPVAWGPTEQVLTPQHLAQAAQGRGPWTLPEAAAIAPMIAAAA